MFLVTNENMGLCLYMLFSDSHFGAACLSESNPSFREVADITCFLFSDLRRQKALTKAPKGQL